MTELKEQTHAQRVKDHFSEEELAAAADKVPYCPSYFSGGSEFRSCSPEDPRFLGACERNTHKAYTHKACAGACGRAARTSPGTPRPPAASSFAVKPNGPTAQRGTFKGVWLNEEHTEWALEEEQQ